MKELLNHINVKYPALHKIYSTSEDWIRISYKDKSMLIGEVSGSDCKLWVDMFVSGKKNEPVPIPTVFEKKEKKPRSEKAVPPEAYIAYSIGDLSIDSLGVVRRYGKIIFMDWKQLLLLKMLCKNSDRICTFVEIKKEIYGTETIPNSTISVAIATLRLKMDMGYNKRLIHSSGGIGFFMKEN